MTTQKQRPMLFSAPMVRAILELRKTQTRRIVKPARCRQFGCNLVPCEIAGEVNAGNFTNSRIKPGDVIWGRETWGYLGSESTYPDNTHFTTVCYHADDSRRKIQAPTFEEMMQLAPNQNIRLSAGFDDLSEYQQKVKYDELLSDWWRRKKKIVAIHMPRWASRITLEVTAVRIERLRDISARDAVAEGVTRDMASDLGLSVSESLESFNLTDSRETFQLLWQSIHGTDSWAANPLVWVYTFRAKGVA